MISNCWSLFWIQQRRNMQKKLKFTSLRLLLMMSTFHHLLQLMVPHGIYTQLSSLLTAHGVIYAFLVVVSCYLFSWYNLAFKNSKNSFRCFFWVIFFSAGGIVMASRDGKIVIENTLDARLDVLFRSKLPEVDLAE